MIQKISGFGPYWTGNAEQAMPLPTRFLRNDPAIDGFPNEDFCQRNQIQRQQSSKQCEGPFAPYSKIGRPKSESTSRVRPGGGPGGADSPANRGSESPLSTAILVSDTGQDNGLGESARKIDEFSTVSSQCHHACCHTDNGRGLRAGAASEYEPSELSLVFESHVHNTIIM